MPDVTVVAGILRLVILAAAEDVRVPGGISDGPLARGELGTAEEMFVELPTPALSVVGDKLAGGSVVDKIPGCVTSVAFGSVTDDQSGVMVLIGVLSVVKIDKVPVGGAEPVAGWEVDKIVFVVATGSNDKTELSVGAPGAKFP